MSALGARVIARPASPGLHHHSLFRIVLYARRAIAYRTISLVQRSRRRHEKCRHRPLEKVTLIFVCCMQGTRKAAEPLRAYYVVEALAQEEVAVVQSIVMARGFKTVA